MTILVTGGGGFLGFAIVRLLLANGEQVRTLNRSAYPALDALPVEQVRGDLRDADVVDAAVAGCDTVFHVAAKAGYWGSLAEYSAINVGGTENVLRACRRHGVKKLIYTSSPSVIHHGGDVEGVDESVPYPKHYGSPYPATKAQAERPILAADDKDLSTVALRPHLIWGPGDNHLVPRVVARARAGRLRQVGSKPCLIDTIYIDDAAQAHLDAWRRLETGSACAGRVYFISQGDPRPSWDIINGMVVAAGLPPVNKRIPFWLAFAVGTLLETFYSIARLSGEPVMTRFLARQLSTAHWYDISAARRDLGFAPSLSIEEGFERLGEHLRTQGG